jgi:hypothetical protein
MGFDQEYRYLIAQDSAVYLLVVPGLYRCRICLLYLPGSAILSLGNAHIKQFIP